jgi:hypothetical protein
MKSMKRLRVVLIVGLLALGTAVAVVSLMAASAADAPFLPGITVADNFPRGRVDCRTLNAKTGEMKVKPGPKNW